jgi:hypothetical protein
LCLPTFLHFLTSVIQISTRQVRQAYLRLVRDLHPDRHFATQAADPAARARSEDFLRVRTAFDTILSARARATGGPNSGMGGYGAAPPPETAPVWLYIMGTVAAGTVLYAAVVCGPDTAPTR